MGRGPEFDDKHADTAAEMVHASCAACGFPEQPACMANGQVRSPDGRPKRHPAVPTDARASHVEVYRKT